MKEGCILWSAESSRKGIVVSDRRRFQCGGGKDHSVLPRELQRWQQARLSMLGLVFL
jgi:hypothetical protein